MKATVDRKDLADALAIAASASSPRSSHPILQAIRIEAGASALELTGCDGEMWAWATAAASVAETGGACVQQKLFSDIVNVMPAGPIEIELDGTLVFLRQGQSEWKLLAMPAEEFPPVPEVGESARLTLPMQEFREAVDSVIFAVAEDMTRPYLAGVQFGYDGQALTTVATDTHRLAVNRIMREGIGSEIKATVPEKALRSMKALPLGPEEPINLVFDETRLTVDVGSAKIVAQQLAGQYPNWERHIPQEFTRMWTVDRAELYENVKRAMVIARDAAKRVRFSGKGDRVVILAQSTDKGEAREEVPVISKNGEVDIAFNGEYIMQALAALPGEGVVAEMTEPSRPAVIRPVEGGENRFCVVMPMALG